MKQISEELNSAMTVASIDMIARNDLKGQAVLARIDAEDETKLQHSLPTLEFLSESGARVVIATHSGRWRSPHPIDAVAVRLAELLGRPVNKLDEWKGEAGFRAVNRLLEGEILILENLAYEDGEDLGDDQLADALGRLADIYCNDAFALAHEIRASTVGAAKRARRALAGVAFEHELHMLEIMLAKRTAPILAVFGGEVSKDKMLLAEAIARSAHRTLVAGLMASPFLIARGLIAHRPGVTPEMVIIAERMMAEARDAKRDLSTPSDFTVVDRTTFERLSRGEPIAPAAPVQNVADEQIICDIGEATRWSWSDCFAPARTIFWHGPLGVCEIDLFCEGTRFLATELAHRTWPALHRKVVCGTSLVAALRRIGFPIQNIRHLTHGGRASFIAAIEAALATEEKEIVVVAQRDALVNEPRLTDLYAIGTKAVIKKMARKANNLLEVVLLGVERVVLLKLDKEGDHYKARIKPLPLSRENNTEIEALHREVTELAIRALALTQPQAAEELGRLISSSKDPVRTVFTLAPMFSLELEKEQSLLEAPTVADILRLMHSYLTHELQVLELRNKIASQAQTEMSKEQREYLLHQQMRAIQKELGGENPEQSEIALLRERFSNAQLALDFLAHFLR